MKFFSLIIIISACSLQCLGTPFELSFAVVTDIHVGRGQSVEALISVVNDINRNPEISFVLVTGDIANRGTESELLQAKEILTRLEKPYYAIPGNHENMWSSSGGKYFSKVFRDNKFFFENSGYCFIGLDCGLMLRHGLGHVPKEQLIWLKEKLSGLDNKNVPIIFANHYPMNKGVDNHFEVIDILKERNIQLMLCGHGHKNKLYGFSGIPGVMCASVLTGKYGNNLSSYNQVKIVNNTASFFERVPGVDSIGKKPWAMIPLEEIPKDSIKIERPDYSINFKNESVSVKWEYADDYDIYGGFVVYDSIIYSGTSYGELIAINKNSGEKLWSYNAGGTVFSTPSVSGGSVVFTSTNGSVYCITTRGELSWIFKSEKAVVSSPIIKDNKVFVGYSDGSYRCHNLKNGKVIWEYNELTDGFVQTSLLYKGNVYFGAWNSTVYALDEITGELVWKWNTGKSMVYSPALVPPIGANGNIFVVTPDYYVTSLAAETGKITWRERKAGMRVWFSRGLSSDSTVLYVKTRNNFGFGISTFSDSLQILWKAPLRLDDDISPTSIQERYDIVFFGSKGGKVIAVSKTTKKILWEYKVSHSFINEIVPVSKNEIFVSTGDGKILCLTIR